MQGWTLVHPCAQMKRILIVVITLLLGAAGSLLAHGSKKHVLGTVAKIDPDLIVVEIKNGKTVEIRIAPTTVFLKDGQAAKLKDLALGDRVAIHATPQGAILEADEVRIGIATTKAEPSASKPKP